jgi:hypothetical protein
MKHSNSSIMTFTGLWFDPLNPDPADICIEDIAHALASNNRFTGHARIPYSVAEHCVRMSHITPPELALDALMHDVAEAYIPDLAAPVKRDPRLAIFCEMEDKIEAACRAALGLPGDEHDPRVKEFDNIMLVTEARDLGLAWWNWRYDSKPLDDEIVPWNWERAKRNFLARWEELSL